MIKIIYEEEDDSIKETYQNQQKHNKMNNVLKNLNQAPEVFNHKFGFFVAYQGSSQVALDANTPL